MFGLLENQSFSSLLEGYHPEVNDLFGLVFNKADSMALAYHQVASLTSNVYSDYVPKLG